MVISLPMFEKEKYALGITTMEKHTIEQVVDESGGNILPIKNEVGNLFTIQTVKNREQPAVLADMDLDYNQLKVMREKDKTYIVLKLDYNNWIYRLEADSSVIGTMIRNLGIGLVAVSLALVGLIDLLSYLFSNRFTRLISQVQERLNLKSKGFSEKELDLVARSVSQIIGEEEALSTHLVTQEPQLEALFVLSLFRSRIERRELDQRLQQFGYSSQGSCHYTALVQTDPLEDSYGGERDLLLLAISNMITEIVPEGNRMLPIILNEGMQATIYRVDRDDAETNKKVMRYCRPVQKHVREYLNLTISIDISSRFETLNESKQSVDRAKEVLCYRVDTGPSSIISYQEIVPVAHERTFIRYPVEEQNRLLEATRSGNQEMKNLVHELIDALFAQNKDPLSREVVSVRLINEPVQLGQLLGVDSKNFDNVKQIYVKALNNYHPRELEKFVLEQPVLPIIECSQAVTDHEFKNLSGNIMHIVYVEYDRDLSLDVIADRLHYNPNYLGNVFKEETREKSGDLVQNHRLGVTKEWLKETDLSVKEIAERLQYRNPQNFIRFFKKREPIALREY